MASHCQQLAAAVKIQVRRCWRCDNNSVLPHLPARDGVQAVARGYVCRLAYVHSLRDVYASIMAECEAGVEAQVACVWPTQHMCRPAFVLRDTGRRRHEEGSTNTTSTAPVEPAVAEPHVHEEGAPSPAVAPSVVDEARRNLQQTQAALLARLEVR